MFSSGIYIPGSMVNVTARAERDFVVADIVHVESDVVSKAVNEILVQRLAVQIFTMGLDVVTGDLVQRNFRYLRQAMTCPTRMPLLRLPAHPARCHKFRAAAP